MKDGLLQVEYDHLCLNNCIKVALVISPNLDFHWYREDKSRLWSHKPGIGPVTYFDNSENFIRDPRTADRGPYTIFCGYFCVYRDRVNIKLGG